ncbi:hypothetical protein [Candidatus Fukatsuia endosymbiont of Tuberolachnus salignus]|uniref:hypothetical protein n=1 Tax=Candidatus Fukatsuia endosymbiont of Tuberolachnus salignus TaxID=3077957 RepID=UPI00313DEF83
MLVGTDKTAKERKGNKTFYGEAGNDFLTGGAGDDCLDGGVGNDTLRGNQGHDRLAGGEEDDTYLYRLGDGNDVINEIGGHDTLAFLGDITEGDVQLQRQGSDLYLLITAKEGINAGKIRVENHFSSADNRLEKLQIAGKEYNISQLLGANVAFNADETEEITLRGLLQQSDNLPSRNTLAPLTQAMSSLHESGQQSVGPSALPAPSRQPLTFGGNPLNDVGTR